MDAIFVIGASGHAKVVIDIVEREGRLRVAGLIDARLSAGAEHFGYPVLGDESRLAALAEAHGVGALIVAVGDNSVRADVARRVAAAAPALTFATAVHPSASVARGVVVGAGSVVMAGAVLNPDTRVGRHCIVNTGACLDHDGQLGDYASLGPGAMLGGTVRVGEYSHIGIGASVIHNVTIGEHTIIGAGAVVTADIPPLVVAMGVPARTARPRKAGERYY